MPWTGTVVLDADKTNVGTAYATWNAGQPDQFVYSRRARMTAAERDAFVLEAKAALAAEQDKRTREATFSTSLTTALNG